MYREVSLFGVPVFYVYKNELSDDYFNLAISEFDKERGKYGFRKLRQVEMSRIRKKFIQEHNLKLAFHSKISFELYKQGRTRKWLYRTVIGAGYPEISFISFTKRIHGYVALEKNLELVIRKALQIF